MYITQKTISYLALALFISAQIFVFPVHASSDAEISKHIVLEDSANIVSQAITIDEHSSGVDNSFVVSAARYTSNKVTTHHSFTGMVGSWTRESGAHVFVRSGNSLVWREMERIDSDTPDGRGIQDSRAIGETVSAVSSNEFQYKVVFDASEIGKEFAIHFVLFTPPKSDMPARISADTAGLGPQITSRSSWGANSSYMTWKPEYSEVKAIVIHHTAADDSRITGVDPKDMVRNIYYGHAVTYGWGDIGYNYVVDLNGGIYEGRSGGNSVIAGHASGYNPGTIGISVIGDYNVRNVEQSQFEAITDLVAYLAYKNRIDPAGTVKLINKIIPTIVGHQDLNPTSCPGNTLYSRMEMVRIKVAEKLAAYPARQYAMQVLSSEGSLQMNGGETKNLRVSLKNSGNIALLSAGAHKLEFRSSDTAGLSVGLEDFGASVEAGEIRTLNLAVTAPLGNMSQQVQGDFYVDGTILSGTHVQFGVTVTTPAYGAKIVGQSPEQTVKAGSAPVSYWVDVKNIGSTSWNGSENIRLVTTNQADSAYFTAGDWVTKSNAGTLDGSTVPTGSNGRIAFLFTPPTNPGKYQEKFSIKSDQNLVSSNPLEVTVSITVTADTTPSPVTPTPVVVPTPTPTPAPLTPVPSPTPGSGQSLTPMPTPPRAPTPSTVSYDAQLTEQSPYPTTSKGLAYNMSVKFKNTGTATWDKSKVHLSTTNANDRSSIFATSAWLSPNRLGFLENSVAPGEIATFIIPLNTDQKDGVYREYFRLVAEGIDRFGVNGMYWDITIKPSFDDFAFVAQSAFPTMTPGSTTQVWIEVKNTGSTTWQKGGATPVRLATANPRDRISQFTNSNRVQLDQDSVAPGQNGRFTFTVTAPNSQSTYKEYFTLVRDGVAWFKDIGIYWQFIVTSGAAQPGAQNTTGTSVAQTPITPTVPQVVSPAPIPSDGKSIQVTGSGDFKIVDGLTLATIATGVADDTAAVSYSAGTYTTVLQGKTYTSANYVRFVPTHDATIFTLPLYSDRPTWNPNLNDNAFKGVMEIRYSTVHKKLWAIDELFIEDYLKGVSESIDTFPAEYLKVSSIIQRSYALYHYRLGGRHKDDFLTLKNSRNGNGDDQIFQGYNFTKRAVNIGRGDDATAGEIVTYNGKPVITPYYTQSDGRTRAASEVWNFKQSDYPWLTSVSDPGSAGLPLLGHGVGLPGRGARDLINQGKTYKEVLQYFYQGTDTTKVDESGINIRVGIYSIDS
ncbi:MAG: NBR1-Ig-like domain-containing protein [Patescibacteria group bacterium]